MLSNVRSKIKDLMTKIIKRFLGELMVVLGTGIFSFNVFNFSYEGAREGGIRLPSLNGELKGVAYFYDKITLLLIAMGAILIISGILIIRNRKNQI